MLDHSLVQESSLNFVRLCWIGIWERCAVNDVFAPTCYFHNATVLWSLCVQAHPCSCFL